MVTDCWYIIPITNMGNIKIVFKCFKFKVSVPAPDLLWSRKISLKSAF